MRPFAQVDVFTTSPLSGNPVAVVRDAIGLSDSHMAALARWTNLSETTFLLPPTRLGADYRLRIFTPGGELPFAGHPTLGSAAAWLLDHEPAGELIVQECGVGLVPIRREAVDRPAPPRVRQTPLDGAASPVAASDARLSGSMPDGGEPGFPLPAAAPDCGQSGVERASAAGEDGEFGATLAFAAPELTVSEPLNEDELSHIEAALGLGGSGRVIAHRRLVNGPEWCALLLDSAQAVLDLSVDPAVRDLNVGVIGPHPAGGPADYEVRAFASELGIMEDPVTGSLNASLASWLIADRLAPDDYTVRQGTALGRDGRVLITRDAEGIWVGGQVRTVIDGVLAL